MAQILFNLFAAFTLVCAAGVVVNKNAVNAALCLLLSLVGVAGLFVALNAYLLAFVLLLVYAGAVVALFLFIVMLLDTKGDQRPGLKHLSLVACVIAAGLVGVGLYSFYVHSRLPEPVLGSSSTAIGTDLKLYAYQLFTPYLLPVQVIGFLLLAAMLGVIVLSKKFEKPEDAQ